MELIRPFVELWEPTGYSVGHIFRHIQRCARVCYQAEAKDTGESAKDWCYRMLMRRSSDGGNDILASHLAMFEHGTVYLWIGDTLAHRKAIDRYLGNRYSSCGMAQFPDKGFWVTTNMRVIVENNWEEDLQFLCDPMKCHESRHTFAFTCDIGTSREFNRHRANSVAESSTRYCNFSKEKFGKEITYVIPPWMDIPEGKAYLRGSKCYRQERKEDGSLDFVPVVYDDMTQAFLKTLSMAESSYLELLGMGWKPQEAREVLPLATRTQVVHTATLKDWRHFLALRSDGVSGKPHPLAKELADQVATLLKSNNYL